ncbi:hypothetical protein M8R20_46130 [Pseudomonas sp. R2.Fl]|nr:hypothetical protein [Pseudomonas sp. R2.Fl]MCL6714370.1 hypothetical protein [Pseudomonas sp. R2.Fl]
MRANQSNDAEQLASLEQRALALSRLANGEHADWKLVAELAGQHGIRYRSNAGMVAFIGAITAALSAQPRGVEARQHFIPGPNGDLPCSAEVAEAWDRRDDELAARNQERMDAACYNWLCEHNDWYFIEMLCLQFVAKSHAEFKAKLTAEITKRWGQDEFLRIGREALASGEDHE